MRHREESGITEPRDILSRFSGLSKIAVIRDRRQFHPDFQQTLVIAPQARTAWGSIKDKS